MKKELAQKNEEIARLKEQRKEIINQIFEWQKKHGIVSICSKHQIPYADCDLCNAQIEVKLKSQKLSVEEIEKILNNESWENGVTTTLQGEKIKRYHIPDENFENVAIAISSAMEGKK